MSPATLSLITTKPTSFCSQKFWGLLLLALEPWVGEPGMGLGSPGSSRGSSETKIFPQFLSTTHGCGTSLFHISAPSIVSVWLLLYIFSYRIFVQLDMVVLSDSCNFDMVVGGFKYCIYLFCHLDQHLNFF